MVAFVVAIIFVPRPFACLECTYVVVAAFFTLCCLACASVRVLRVHIRGGSCVLYFVWPGLWQVHSVYVLRAIIGELMRAWNIFCIVEHYAVSIAVSYIDS